MALATIGGGYFYWQEYAQTRLPDGITQANGRIEAEQIHIATKLAGRVIKVIVHEGDMVYAGDGLAQMDADELEAQLRAFNAQATMAEKSLELLPKPWTVSSVI